MLENSLLAPQFPIKIATAALLHLAAMSSSRVVGSLLHNHACALDLMIFRSLSLYLYQLLYDEKLVLEVD